MSSIRRLRSQPHTFRQVFEATSLSIVGSFGFRSQPLIIISVDPAGSIGVQRFLPLLLEVASTVDDHADLLWSKKHACTESSESASAAYLIIDFGLVRWELEYIDDKHPRRGKDYCHGVQMYARRRNSKGIGASRSKRESSSRMNDELEASFHTELCTANTSKATTTSSGVRVQSQSATVSSSSRSRSAVWSSLNHDLS